MKVFVVFVSLTVALGCTRELKVEPDPCDLDGIDYSATEAENLLRGRWAVTINSEMLVYEFGDMMKIYVNSSLLNESKYEISINKDSQIANRLQVSTIDHRTDKENKIQLSFRKDTHCVMFLNFDNTLPPSGDFVFKKIN